MRWKLDEVGLEGPGQAQVELAGALGLQAGTLVDRLAQGARHGGQVSGQSPDHVVGQNGSEW